MLVMKLISMPASTAESLAQRKCARGARYSRRLKGLKMRKVKKKRDKELWSPLLVKVFKNFKTPNDIQLYLNKLKYNSVCEFSSPEQVIKNKKANCTEGAFLGAAALRFLGFKPLVTYILASPNDDDHFLAVFKRNDCWGAVSKSNYSVLRYREPVYKNLRELVMSYFDAYFNSIGQKTMRAYTVQVNLERFDKYNWMTTKKDVSFIGDYFDTVKQYEVLDKRIIRSLSPVDEELLEGALMHSDRSGLFKPKKKMVK